MSDAYTSPFAGIDQLDAPPSALDEASELDNKKVNFLKTCFMEAPQKTVNPPYTKEKTEAAKYDEAKFDEARFEDDTQDDKEDWNELPGLEHLEVKTIKVEAPSRKLNATWRVEGQPERFTIVGDMEKEDLEYFNSKVMKATQKEETDAERYDRVMNSLLENPLK